MIFTAHLVILVGTIEMYNPLIHSHSYGASKCHTCGLYDVGGNCQFITVVTAHPNIMALSCMRESTCYFTSMINAQFRIIALSSTEEVSMLVPNHKTCTAYYSCGLHEDYRAPGTCHAWYSPKCLSSGMY
jgi:hypothetical protein